MTNGHAMLSPSGAKKWMTCPGSVAMEHGEPNGGSEYSDQGTAAHALAAMCLVEQDLPPSAFEGRVLRIVNGVYTSDGDALGPKDSTIREFTVDDDMIEGVSKYTTKIKEYAAGNELHVEIKVPVGHITGEKDAEGTSDAVIITSDLELQVHDLKYGMGVKVYAENNPQGILYILGAMEMYEPVYGEIKSARFVIHQPRLDHLDECVYTREQLIAFKEELKGKAWTAMHAFEYRDNWLGKTAEYLTPGIHCREAFCKARHKCPALANFVQQSVGADFDDLTKGQVTADLLNENELEVLGAKARAVAVIEDWCKQVLAAVERKLREAFNAGDAIKALGFKLVGGKKGARAWLDKDQAEAAMKAMRLKVEEMYKMSVISPTQAEKTLKNHPRKWAKLEGMIVQSEGQPHVASADDKRPPLEIKPAADDFANLDQPDDGSNLV